jgi:hypothetical protein
VALPQRARGGSEGEGDEEECRRVRQNARLRRAERWGGETLSSFPTRGRGGLPQRARGGTEGEGDEEEDEGEDEDEDEEEDEDEGEDEEGGAATGTVAPP